MNNLDNTGKLERHSSLADHTSILKGQTAVDAAKAIEEDISRRFGVFIEEHVSGIVQAAINKATADLRAQLAERDAQLAAMRDTLASIYALIPTHDYLCYGTSEAAMRGFLMLITHKCQAVLDATRQPTQDKGDE